MNILIVYDVNGWAWNFMANGIEKYSPEEYEVEVVSNGEYGGKQKSQFDKFDAIFAMSWVEMGFPKNFKNRKVSLLAAHGAEFPWPPISKAYSAQISTRLRNSRNAKEKLPSLDAIVCVSRNLQDVASQFNKNSHFCHPGVDHEIFRPVEREIPSRLKLGWCSQRRGNTKGHDSVLSPVISALGDRFDWVVNNRDATNPLTQTDMVSWFQEIDILLSTSSSEGSQMPVMEAAACGKPVIATNVGTASEVINDMDTGYVVSSYETKDEAKQTVNQIVDSLIHLDQNRNRLVSMGMAARQRIENLFTWERQAPVWLKAIVG